MNMLNIKSRFNMKMINSNIRFCIFALIDLSQTNVNAQNI